jgi:integrase
VSPQRRSTPGRSTLRLALDDYLSMRRALGYKLERPGQLLAQFVGYLDGLGAEHVTVEHALAWATSPVGAKECWWSLRLSAVRGFVRYLHTLDPAHQVPPVDVLPHRSHRATPYLYSDDDIAALISAAAGLRFPLQAATYQSLIGLLAVTGLRVGEAIRLDRADLDHTHGLLTVRHSKFGKSREVPLHPSTLAALSTYLHRRDQLHPSTTPDAAALFVSTAGTRLIYANVHLTFQRLVGHAGLRPRSGSCRPRIHDLRHSFAVHTLLQAYRAGDDVQARLPLLSTYLGHVHPGSTYWYLSAAPELLALAGQRLDRSQQAPS